MKQNLIEDVCKGGDLLKYYYYYYYYYYRDCRQQVTFFSRTNCKRGKVQRRHAQTACIKVTFKTLITNKLRKLLLNIDFGHLWQWKMG